MCVGCGLMHVYHNVKKDNDLTLSLIILFVLDGFEDFSFRFLSFFANWLSQLLHTLEAVPTFAWHFSHSYIEKVFF